MASPAPKIRKPLDALTPEDLRAHVLWACPIEDEGDEDLPEEWDESWLTPFPGTRAPREHEGPLWAATRFQTSDAREFLGVLCIEGGEVIDYEGALLVDGKCVSLARSRAGRAEMAAAMGLPEANLFPLRYEVLAKLPLLSLVPSKGVLE